MEANDAVTVASMTRPKPLPNEVLSDLAVSAATKLQCFRVILVLSLFNFDVILMLCLIIAFSFYIVCVIEFGLMQEFVHAYVLISDFLLHFVDE